MSISSIRMGIYRHYKGELYQVIGLAHDANHDDRTLVVYMPLQLNAAHLGPRMAVRTIEDFETQVHVSYVRDNWPACPSVDRCSIAQRTAEGRLVVEHWEQNHRQRFEYLGAVLVPSMLEPVAP